MGVIIEESGLRFGEYDEDQVFRIETSAQYTKSLRNKGIKSCEFVLKKDSELFFIEAKSSCPRQVTKDVPDDKKESKEKKYEEFIEEIASKMRHSLALYGNILLKRYSQEGLTSNLADTDLSEYSIKLILVINTKDEKWTPAPELRDAIEQYLKEEIKIWKTAPFLVITQEEAREKGLIV